MARLPDMDLADETARPMPNRRSESALDYRASLSPRPRGLRAALAPDRLIGAAKTLAWLVPLTLLIWVYAEREQSFDTRADGVPVSVQAALPNRYVEFAGPTQQPTVNLSLTGPHDAVDRVKSQLYSQHGLVVDVGAGPGMGQQVSVVDAIQNLPLFRTAGVTVQKSEPGDVLVNVDTVQEREAIVEGDPHVTNLAGPPAFDPPRVTVRGPKTQLDELEQAEKPGDGKLRVYADLSKFADALRHPGAVSLTSVPVGLPVTEDKLQVLPAQVSAKLQVRAADVQYTIDSVPIKITAAPGTLRQYDVTVGDNDTSTGYVQVTGPADQVALLEHAPGQPPRFQPTAELDVEPGDFGREEPRELTYKLPEGVKVAPEDQAKKFRFTLTRRDTGTGG